MNPTRVALVDTAAQMSGVEFSTLFLAQNLDRTRWNPLVICPSEGDLLSRCRAQRIEVAVVPTARFFSISMRVAKHRVLNPFVVLWNTAAFLPSAWRLARALRKLNVNLVVTKGLFAHFYGGLAARYARLPCVWHVQDRVSERMGSLFPLLLSATGSQLAEEIIADAESVARQMRLRIPPERVTVVWNGVNLCEFSPQVDGRAVRTEWCNSPEDLLIGSIARLTPWKGQHILLQSFARIAERFPTARLVVVGSALFDTDEYARRLKQIAQELGIAARVHWAGFRRDLPQVLAALDIVAHPALEKDSSPLAVVSALASGKPIVCTAVDGTAELFQDGVNGLLVPPGDVYALSKNLARLLGDADLRQQLGHAARRFAERVLSVDQFTRHCEQVFDRALTA